MAELTLDFKFLTHAQEEFFNLTCRNQCFSGGYGNGKTFVGCQKIVYILATFPNSRAVIARFEESKLRQTTMKTFYNVCPPALYDEKLGGVRADSLNYCRFVNNSEVIFLHLKDYDERVLRGLEVNVCLVDQAEEIAEQTFTTLSARIGRWSEAKVPENLLELHPSWPKLPNGNYKVPSYLMLLCNPDSELHWIYRRFHPESEDWQNKYIKNNKMVQAGTTAETIDDEILEEMKSNDPSWVNRFVYGKWGIPEGNIHLLTDASLLEVGKTIDIDTLRTIIQRGHKTRILDHGDTAPTCCLWFVAYKDWYICYREYYKPDALISTHRKNIAALSQNENYVNNLADPSIFKKTSQKYGGRWSVSDEYGDPNIFFDLDKKTPCPQLYWSPADNDELSTRNRISELLLHSRSVSHPVSNVSPSPRLFFVKKTQEWPNGCNHAITELKAQRREKIGNVNGKDLFSDDRDPNISDHSYDCIRYFCASHQTAPHPQKPTYQKGSFFDVKKQLKAYKQYGYSQLFGKNPVVRV